MLRTEYVARLTKARTELLSLDNGLSMFHYDNPIRKSIQDSIKAANGMLGSFLLDLHLYGDEDIV